MSKQVGNVALMQKMNRLRVLNHIRRNPDISRPLISEQTGLSLASITNITSYLLDVGLLAESGIEPVERVGRKSTLLRFCSESYGLVIATIGGDTADVFYTDLEGRILSRITNSTDSLSCEQVIALIRKNVASLLDEYGKASTLGVSIDFSGLVLGGVRFVFSSSMKWKEMDIKKIFEDDTGLPVFVENISRLRAVGYISTCTDSYYKNTLFADLDNGIGAVVLTDGSVDEGVLGEIGHTTVQKDGLPCFCGNRGCLEAMCSASRLVQLYSQSSGKGEISLSALAELYTEGDIHAKNAINECSSYLGMGFANLISLFHPSVLVVNRGQFAECDIVIELATREMKSRAYRALWQDMDIRYIDIDFNQTIKGAAFEMCDRIFDISFPANPVQ